MFLPCPCNLQDASCCKFFFHEIIVTRFRQCQTKGIFLHPHAVQELERQEEHISQPQLVSESVIHILIPS